MLFNKAKSKTAQIAPASYAALAFPELLEPISEAEPCGKDLEYDTEFVLLQASASPGGGAQYGEFVSTPEAINWSDVERDCRRLLLRTRDIRILVLLLRSRVRQDDAAGLRDGLAILAQLLMQWPDAIHPQFIVDGEPDPAVRANALAALTDPQGLLQDIRELAITPKGAMRLQVRDVERALKVPRIADALAPESVLQQLQDLRRKQDPTMQAFEEALGFAVSIDAWARQYLPHDHPELTPLLKLLGLVADTTPRLAVVSPPTEHSEPLPAATLGEHDTGPNAGAPRQSLQLPSEHQPLDRPMDRETVLDTIRNARAWFETHEPSSPVALLLKQAERLTGKPFGEVFQAIPADLVQRWTQEH
ncbi:type VI secretion system protein TssA [Ralstonia mannitolilytica]|uniref:type VI secretion system protein TssA n=1 Tax=Ralstonia mannitolilytica TaxID=105219 RepID=UPI000CEDECD2|nr:type VI secretion system protein TssA [Ralstonia mannitolilytica]MBU9579628.1 type VI secretion system protein TssA [Ralstonia mannitolilytica]